MIFRIFGKSFSLDPAYFIPCVETSDRAIGYGLDRPMAVDSQSVDCKSNSSSAEESLLLGKFFNFLDLLQILFNFF
jgi:hypothetical protein